MAEPQEKLAASLDQLRALQEGGRRVFRSKELGRIHRERLLKQGFLREVMKGWLIASSPGARPEDSTPWLASFWKFCARYCNERFGDGWQLSPEQSLLLHTERTAVPTQIIIYSPKGTNNLIHLLFGTSLYDLKHEAVPSRTDIVVRDGLRLYSPIAALMKVPVAFYTRYPVEAQVALAGIRDPSDMLSRLLDGGHSVVAGRLAGAMRRIGRTDMADEMVSTMKAAGYDVRETDPFEPGRVLDVIGPSVSPIVGRLRAMWQSYRDVVLDNFPRAPGLPKDRKEYLRFIDDIYPSDAYHSLSIEGYAVTSELVERVRSGAWDPEHHGADRDSRDALAARGYWQAFQLVKSSVAAIIAGENAGQLVRTAHQKWYRELFQPYVAAGLMKASVLAGYRKDTVFLRTSRHVPPRWETVRDAMPVFFELLVHESEPSVRAVLGHWMFGYIHPYPDGNGRMARFVMNAMLASGGYPWTVIPVEDREAYLESLEGASVAGDIGPFAEFVAARID
jgi:fido (protein-threonine AMPylation protein)